MKKNIKIAAAIILVLVLAMPMFGALATEGETVIPTETPIVETTPVPTEEPAVDPTEEPAADPTEEPEVDPTEEPAADPTEEPAVDPTEEPAADPTEEPAVDPTEEPEIDPTVEPTPVPVEGTVEVKLATTGDIYIGDVVKFEAVIEGYTMEYTIQWQYDDGYGWKNIEGANEEELRVEVTEKNAEWAWRVAVITEDVEAEA